jgi:predicted transcriptional regulator
MNKQEDTNKKTTLHNINVNAIINLHLRNKTFQPIRKQYPLLNYNCITTLIGIYLFNEVMNKRSNKTNLYLFIRVYNMRMLLRYIDQLLMYSLITQGGKRNNEYKLTDTGLLCITDISNSVTSLVYSFCEKYNIIL